MLVRLGQVLTWQFTVYVVPLTVMLAVIVAVLPAPPLSVSPLPGAADRGTFAVDREEGKAYARRGDPTHVVAGVGGLHAQLGRRSLPGSARAFN